MSAVISERVEAGASMRPRSQQTAVLLLRVWRPMRPLPLPVRAATPQRSLGEEPAQVAWVTHLRLQGLYVVEQMGTG